MRASSRCGLLAGWRFQACVCSSQGSVCAGEAPLWHPHHLVLALTLTDPPPLPLPRPCPAPQAVVREGDQYTDHPVHLGGAACVLAELKVTPVVEKKVPGK